MDGINITCEIMKIISCFSTTTSDPFNLSQLLHASLLTSCRHGVTGPETVPPTPSFLSPGAVGSWSLFVPLP